MPGSQPTVQPENEWYWGNMNRRLSRLLRRLHAEAGHERPFLIR
jgi:hypothetical protein